MRALRDAPKMGFDTAPKTCSRREGKAVSGMRSRFPDARSSSILGKELESQALVGGGMRTPAPVSAADTGCVSAGAHVLHARRFWR